jgi:hypothetical protein
VLARPRFGALGLRGRIVGAVLVTAVATLVVAAVVLLGPLETPLRNAELTALKNEVSRSTTATFAHANPGLAIYYKIPTPQKAAKPAKSTTPTGKDIHLSPPARAFSEHELQAQGNAATKQAELQADGEAARAGLLARERSLGERIGASEVAVLGYPEPSGHGAHVVVAWPDQRLNQYGDAVIGVHDRLYQRRRVRARRDPVHHVRGRRG